MIETEQTIVDLKDIRHSKISADYLDLRMMLSDRISYPNGVLENRAKTLIDRVQNTPNGEAVLQEIADGTRNSGRLREVNLTQGTIEEVR